MPVTEADQERKQDVSTEPSATRGIARWWPTVAVVAVLIVYFFLTNRPAPKLVGWGHDFDVAKADASASGRAMLVAFESNDCPPCVLMDRTVLSAEIIRGAIQNFVPVRVDASSRPDLLRDFEVDGTPTYVVIDPQGRRVGQVSGYRPVEDFLVFLKDAQSALVKDRVAATSEPRPSSQPDAPPVPAAP